MIDKEYLLRAITGGGSLDIVHLINEFENWKVDPFEIDWIDPAYNLIIRQIYETVADRYELEDYDYFINCMDSHFYYKEEEVHNIEELKERIKKESNND